MSDDNPIKRWTAKHKAAVVMDILKGKTTVAGVARQRDKRHTYINRLFRGHRYWLDNTLKTEDDPNLQVAADFTGQAAKERP